MTHATKIEIGFAVVAALVIVMCIASAVLT